MYNIHIIAPYLSPEHPRSWFLLILPLDLLIPCHWLEIKYFHRGNETDLSRCGLMPGWVTSAGGSAELRRERVISPGSDKTINTDNLISGGQGRRLWVIHHKQGHQWSTWLSHAPWYLHFTWCTASKCHADYVASIMMTDCLVCSWHSSCHDVTPDKWGRSIRDWPRTWLGSVQWQHISHDQETRPHTPRVCSHVRCWVISWLSELLNILYWGNPPKNVRSSIES